MTQSNPSQEHNPGLLGSNTTIALVVIYMAVVGVFTLEYSRWPFVDSSIPLVALLAGVVLSNVAVVCGRFVGRKTGSVPSTQERARLALYGIPVLVALDLAIAINCALDSSPSQPVSIAVVSTHATSGRSPHYTVDLRLSPSDPNLVSLSIDQYTYQQIQQAPEGKRAVLVDLRKGRLGFPWYASIRPAQ